MSKQAKHCDCVNCTEHELLVDEENKMWDKFLLIQIKNRKEELKYLHLIRQHSKKFVVFKK